MKNKTTIVYLTKDEIDGIKEFCDENLSVGVVEIHQSPAPSGHITVVQIKNVPETRTDITEYTW